MVGELTKLKKHVEWSLDVSMKDTLRDNKKGRLERDQSLQDIMTQLQESMDKLQENLKLVAERIERGTPPAEVPPAYDPPLAPMTPAMTPAGPGPSIPPRRRRCRQGLQSQHHRRYRRCDLQGIARQGWAKCQ